MMGWRLAEEVAWSRPDHPGPEWWTLLDLAQDANDDTRRAMPGRDHLMARAKVSRSTIQRRLKKLADAGLLKVVEHSAPGRRAVYEIPLIFTEPKQVSAVVSHEHVAPYVSLEHVNESQKSRNRSQTGPQQVAPYGESPLVTTFVTSPVITPNGSDLTPAVEGRRGRHVKNRKSIRERIRNRKERSC